MLLLKSKNSIYGGTGSLYFAWVKKKQKTPTPFTCKTLPVWKQSKDSGYTNLIAINRFKGTRPWQETTSTIEMKGIQ